MINGISSKYLTPPHSEREGAIGHYFPDTLILTLHKLTQDSSDNVREEPVLRPISLDEAKNHIIEALTQFDPSIGQEAAVLLAKGSPRNNIREIDGPLRVMGVRPPGLKEEDALIHPDAEIAASIAEHFPDRGNNLDHAVIDYEFNGSLEAVIYLGHEVGHAIAYDRQNDIGNTYQENPVHMEETQAYFTQAIVTHHLCSLAETDPNLAHAAQVFWQNHRAGHNEDFNTAFETQSERLHYRAPSALLSEKLVQHLSEQSPETIRATIDMLMGGQGPLEINAILSRAGIETVEHLQGMLEKTTMSNAMSPRPNMIATLST